MRGKATGMTGFGAMELAVYAGFAWLGFASVYLGGKALKARGIVGRDINKPGEPALPESAGIALLPWVWAFVLSYQLLMGVALDLLALACLATGYALVGFLDDTRNKFAKKPMGWMERALPLAVLTLAFAWNYGGGSGNPTGFVLTALFVGTIASLHNTFAGLNGWEVGTSWMMGLAGLVLVWDTPLLLPALAFNALALGLLAWNVFPARVFPGDSGTLLFGALNAGLIALTADLKLMGFYALLFVPHAIDLVGLKLLTNAQDATQQKQRPYALNAQERICLPKYADGRKRLDYAKALLCLLGPQPEERLVAFIWASVAAWMMAAFYFFRPF